ncbi:hypothetical protein GCWU000325_00536 [Alloprevotella tannerae ATCC 51259]|uniref:Uncharacterized protein n=1 Tax=Alloprevotella tannerae ATCC 51259 TaxID=626522 RepID=C9LEB0_9BACT|nr:hypothetical protein GCWU000325_00536 [Alloprevotella tannerae ATCC 51259]
MKKCGIFADFIDDIGYFGMYLGRGCSCFWTRMQLFLDGDAVVFG